VDTVSCGTRKLDPESGNRRLIQSRIQVNKLKISTPCFQDRINREGYVPVRHDCRTLVETAAMQASLGSVAVKNDLPPGIEVFADPLIARVCLMDNAAGY